MCQPAEWLVRAVEVTGMLVMVRDAAVGCFLEGPGNRHLAMGFLNELVRDW